MLVRKKTPIGHAMQFDGSRESGHDIFYWLIKINVDQDICDWDVSLDLELCIRRIGLAIVVKMNPGDWIVAINEGGDVSCHRHSKDYFEKNYREIFLGCREGLCIDDIPTEDQVKCIDDYIKKKSIPAIEAAIKENPDIHITIGSGQDLDNIANQLGLHPRKIEDDCSYRKRLLFQLKSFTKQTPTPDRPILNHLGENDILTATGKNLDRLGEKLFSGTVPRAIEEDDSSYRGRLLTWQPPLTEDNTENSDPVKTLPLWHREYQIGEEFTGIDTKTKQEVKLAVIGYDRASAMLHFAILGEYPTHWPVLQGRDNSVYASLKVHLWDKALEIVVFDSRDYLPGGKYDR